jgi:hypothetical protein
MIYDGASETEIDQIRKRVAVLEKWAETMSVIVAEVMVDDGGDDGGLEAQHQRMMARRRMERVREQ